MAEMVKHTCVRPQCTSYLSLSHPAIPQRPFLPPAPAANPITSCLVGVPPLAALNKGLCGTLQTLLFGLSFLKGVKLP